jgi:hypothetical protein
MIAGPFVRFQARRPFCMCRDMVSKVSPKKTRNLRTPYLQRPVMPAPAPAPAPLIGAYLKTGQSGTGKSQLPILGVWWEKDRRG